MMIIQCHHPSVSVLPKADSPSLSVRVRELQDRNTHIHSLLKLRKESGPLAGDPRRRTEMTRGTAAVAKRGGGGEELDSQRLYRQYRIIWIWDICRISRQINNILLQISSTLCQLRLRNHNDRASQIL